MKKIITNLPLLAMLAIASIMMLSHAYGQSAPSIADLVEQDAAQNAEVVPTSTIDDEDNSGGNGDDEDLTATLNGETFYRGDPITVRGTVAEREGGSLVFINILDPDGIEHGTYTATVTNNLTFTFGLVAGQHRSMDKFGTYTIIFTYFQPPRGLAGVETTDVSFEYVSGSPTTGTTTTALPPTTTGAQPQGVEIILMQNGTGVIVDNSDPNLSQNRATFNWTQTGGSPIRFENSTIIQEQ